MIVPRVVFAALVAGAAACASSVGSATDAGDAAPDATSSQSVCQRRTRFATDGGIALPVPCSVVAVDGGSGTGSPAGEPCAQRCYFCFVPSDSTGCICNGTRWVCATRADCGMDPDWAGYTGGTPPETCP
jgi:hypothetical protein